MHRHLLLYAVCYFILQALDESKQEAQSYLADISFHYNRLHRLLSTNDMELIRIEPDGDCLFNAVHYLIQKSNDNVTVGALRQIVSDHMLEYPDEYKPFLPENMSYEVAAREIRIPGKWNSALCDAIPLAMCNLLQEPMTIYSSQYGNNITSIVPSINSKRRHVNPVPALQLAHLAMNNCEHYDAVKLSARIMMNVKIPYIQPEYIMSLWDGDDDILQVENVEQVDKVAITPDIVSIKPMSDVVGTQTEHKNIEDGSEVHDDVSSNHGSVSQDSCSKLTANDQSSINVQLTKNNDVVHINQPTHQIINGESNVQTLSSQPSPDCEIIDDESKVQTSSSKQSPDCAIIVGKARVHAYSSQPSPGCEIIDDESKVQTASFQPSPDSINNKQNTRKRTRNPERWIKNKRKQGKNSGKEYTKSTGTTAKKREVKPHSCERCRYKCPYNVTDETRETICQDFWALGSIDRQRDFITNNIEEDEVASRKQNTAERKEVTRKYFLPGKIRVCKSFFSKTLDISYQMITTALAKRTPSLTSKPDMRGKKTPPNKTPEHKVDYIKKHIESFPVIDSHYCRQSSTKHYLEPHLSIKEMYRLYQEKAAEDGVEVVLENVYRDIFNTSYNMSFYKPKKDQCAYCNTYKAGGDITKEDHERHIKNRDDVGRIKEEKAKEAAVENHKHACCFDMEQILQVPHNHLGPIYYMRKLNVYNCSVYSLGDKIGICYVWSEVDGHRGACEVATCMYMYLKSLPTSITHITLFSDSCGSQNRNKYFATMLRYAISTIAHIKVIHHIFMEKGHSHMEVDSMHSAIDYRKKVTNVSIPREYYILMQLARQPKAYAVVPLEYPEFFDFRTLEEDKVVLTNTQVDIDGENVKWLQIKEIMFKEEEDTMFVKYNHCDDFVAVPQRNTRKSLGKEKILMQLYENQQIITKDKKKDLLSMCDSLVIPKEYHSFYRDLPTEVKET